MNPTERVMLVSPCGSTSTLGGRALAAAIESAWRRGGPVFLVRRTTWGPGFRRDLVAKKPEQLG